MVCHQDGGNGPMQFETYDQVRPWAPLILTKSPTEKCLPMRTTKVLVQHLIGDWRLEQSEIDQIVAWVEQGAPLGDPDASPFPYQLKDPNEWNFAAQLGQPDLIVPSNSYDIPANGEPLDNEIVDPGITSDRCARLFKLSLAVMPRQSSITLASVLLENEEGELDRQGMLTEYAMGKWGEMVPEVAKLPAGAQIAWSIHMYPGGVGATAQGEMIEDNVVEIGLWFHEEGYENSENIFKQDLALYRIEEQDDLVIPLNSYQMTQGFHSLTTQFVWIAFNHMDTSE